MGSENRILVRCRITVQVPHSMMAQIGSRASGETRKTLEVIGDRSA
jgi:dUTPase